MQKNTKIAAASAAALAILVAGGLAIALPAQATPVTKSVSVSAVDPVDTPDAADTDNVQDEVEDGTADGEVDEATEGHTEDPSDDVNGVAVEDGTQD